MFKILFVSQRFFSEHVFLEISYRIFKIVIRKLNKRKHCSFSTSVAESWKFLGHLASTVQVSYKEVPYEKEKCMPSSPRLRSYIGYD